MKIESNCCGNNVHWDNIKPGEVVKSVNTGQYYLKTDQGFGVRLSNGYMFGPSAMNRVPLTRVEAKVVIG